MKFEPKLDRVLVVIDTDVLTNDTPEATPTISRALTLGQKTGCDLELFHVRDDAALDQKLFGSDKDVARRRKSLVDEDATRLAELALRLQSHGVTVHHDARADHPPAEAILRKIAETGPDVVMKRSAGQSFLLGLTTNTDWDLIRQSPSHVWFVDDDGAEIERVVTAIGSVSEKDDIISATDYDVFRMANLITDGLEATNVPVHTYQVPQALTAYAAYTPDLGDMNHPAGSLPTVTETRTEVARQHGRAIHAFAEFFHIDPHTVRLAEGQPSEVLPDVASAVEADLIVMGARNLSRWQRALTSVTAESVLADASCDVLFVKDSTDQEHSVGDRKPTQGQPAVDLERAITDPAGTFDSPQAVAAANDLSMELRIRILDAWEQDIRALLIAEGEGASVKSINVDRIDEIHAAKEPLTLARARMRHAPRNRHRATA